MPRVVTHSIHLAGIGLALSAAVKIIMINVSVALGKRIHQPAALNVTIRPPGSLGRVDVPTIRPDI